MDGMLVDVKEICPVYVRAGGLCGWTDIVVSVSILCLVAFCLYC